MNHRVLSIVLWFIGALSLLFVPTLLLYNGWPIDLPTYLHYGVWVRPHLSAEEWSAVRGLLLLFIPIGIICLGAATIYSRKNVKEEHNARPV